MKITRGIGERIRLRRRELGLTQKEIAQHLGRSASAVTQWESGATYPNGQNLVKLAEILKTDAQWILSGDYQDNKWGIDYDDWSTAGAIPTPIFTWEEAGETKDKFDALTTSQKHTHILTTTGGDYEYVLKAKKEHIPHKFESMFPDDCSLVIDCSQTGKSDIKNGKFVLVKANKPESIPVIRRVIDDGMALFLEAPSDGLAAYKLDDSWIVLGIVRQIIIDL
ncbi:MULTISPECIES: helix-turn-helix domain-containing protein [unclassified Pantoea]|uniref:helix-turn-helix domain-containing protein n=1 Tax=unclassified Pantoea TaxID=2630326 RepID=UPI0016802F7A|nr:MULTISPECIES: helix-turn-helix domain-containing protein [unclassified Pantoea]